MEFRVWQIIGTSFRVWFRNFIPFTLLSALIHLPLWIWLWRIFGHPPTAETLAEIERYNRFAWLASLAVNLFLTSMFTYAVVMQLRGAPASIGRSLLVGVTRFVPALGVTLLVVVALVLGFLAIIVPGVVLYCMLYVAVPASVIERPGVAGALRRSRELTMGHKGPIFGMLLVMFLAAFLVGVALGALSPPPERMTWDDVQRLTIESAVVETFVSSFMATLAAVTYARLRELKDGVSAVELARVFD